MSRLRAKQLLLAQVHRWRVIDLVLGGVLAEEHAPVVRLPLFQLPCIRRPQTPQRTRTGRAHGRGVRRPPRRSAPRLCAACSAPDGRCSEDHADRAPRPRDTAAMFSVQGRRRTGKGCRHRSAIRRSLQPRPARYSAKIRRTAGAVCGSGASACSRLPSAALAGLACAPTAVRTWILILFRSPLLIPPNTDMTRSA